MEFKSRIDQDLKESLKNRDTIRASVIRMLLASIKNKEVDKRGILTEDEFFSIVKKSINQHNESIESFRKGNRLDLVEKEEKELAILNTYLPAQVSEEDLVNEIESAIALVGAQNQKDMGKVIKHLLDKFPGRVDGKVVSTMVLKRLSGK